MIYLIVASFHIIFQLITKLLFHTININLFLKPVPFFLYPLHSQVRSTILFEVSPYKITYLLFTVLVPLDPVMDIYGLPQVQVCYGSVRRLLNSDDINTSNMRYQREVGVRKPLLMYQFIANVVSHLLTKKKVRFDLSSLFLVSFLPFAHTCTT